MDSTAQDECAEESFEPGQSAGGDDLLAGTVELPVVPASTAPDPFIQDMDGAAVNVEKSVVHVERCSLWDRAWAWALDRLSYGLNPEGDRV